MSIPVEDSGLRRAIDEQFQCARCGRCCKGDGIVRFQQAEAEQMAQALGESYHHFLKTYAIRIGQHSWMLHDRMVPIDSRPGGAEEKWCIFLERSEDGLYGCRLHEAKPDQCRSFPAQWLNEDSLSTCVGLRLLTAALRREPAGEAE